MLAGKREQESFVPSVCVSETIDSSMGRLSRPLKPRAGKSLPLWSVLVLLLLGWCGRAASGQTESLDIEQVRSACCYSISLGLAEVVVAVFVVFATFSVMVNIAHCFAVELVLRSPQGPRDSSGSILSSTSIASRGA